MVFSRNSSIKIVESETKFIIISKGKDAIAHFTQIMNKWITPYSDDGIIVN